MNYIAVGQVQPVQPKPDYRKLISAASWVGIGLYWHGNRENNKTFKTIGGILMAVGLAEIAL